MLMKVSAALAALGVPTASMSAMAAATPVVSKHYSADAYALAEMMAPTDAPANKMMGEIRALMMSPETMADLRSMDGDYPGLSTEIQKAMEDSLGGNMRNHFQRIREGFAEDYQRELSAAEIGQISSFYRTPAGQKIARSRDEVVDPNEVVRRLVGKVDVAGKNTAARMVIADRILATLSATEVAQVKTFAATPAFGHFTAVSADSLRLERDLANVRDKSSKSLMQAMMGVFEKRTGMHMPTPGEMQQLMSQAPDAQ